MGRRAKTGLDYFPKDVTFYDDFKIMTLLDEYGPNGIAIYDVILCIVYKNGYYIECPDMELLIARIVRMIGNKWIRKKDLVLQVIRFCADIGLFDKTLLDQNVITSAGIQRRYSEVTVRNKVNKEKYWLLGKDDQALLNAPKKPISATEKPISYANMQQIKLKKSKEKNIEADATFSESESEEPVGDDFDSFPSFVWDD